MTSVSTPRLDPPESWAGNPRFMWRFWLYRTGGFPADAARDDQATPANRPRPGQAPKWFLHGLFP